MKVRVLWSVQPHQSARRPGAGAQDGWGRTRLLRRPRQPTRNKRRGPMKNGASINHRIKAFPAGAGEIIDASL